MALTDKSAWQTNHPRDTAPQTQAEPGTGLTERQERMVGSRHPNAWNQGMSQPMPKEDTTPVPKTTPGQQAELGASQAQANAQPRAQPQNDAMRSTVANLSAKMGGLGYTLQKYVNQFLSAASEATGFQTQEVKEYNPDGTLKINVTSTGDTSGVAAEKQQQQAMLQSALNPYTKMVGGQRVAKDFSQLVKDTAENDPQAAQLFQLFATMDQLDKAGTGNSAEARAAREQLQEMDQTGLISGLRQAREDYQRIVGGIGKTGAKWYGDAGDTGYSVMDLANLKADQIGDEVTKALSFSSGLFGGDFEVNLKRTFDTQAAETQGSARKREMLHNELYKSFETWSSDSSSALGAEMAKYKKAFQDIGSEVTKALNASGDGEAARIWAEAIQGGNIADTIYNAISDPNSGLSVEQREKLGQMVQQLSPSNETGWLMSLAKTGKMWVNNTDGTKSQVEPSADQQLAMLTILQDKNMPEDRKQTELQNIIKSIKAGDVNLGTLISDAVTKNALTGNTASALKSIQNSIVSSMLTFAHSYTQDLTRQALGISDEAWDALPEDQRAKLMSDMLANNPNALKDVQTVLKGKQTAQMEEVKQLTDGWDASYKKELDNVTTSINTLKTQKENISNSIINGPQSITSQALSIMTSGQNWDVIKAKLEANPWVQQQLATGKWTQADVTSAMQLYDYSNSYKYLAGQFGGQYAAVIAQKIGIPMSVLNDPKVILGDPKMMASLVSNAQAAFSKLTPDDPTLKDLATMTITGWKASSRQPGGGDVAGNPFALAYLQWEDKLATANKAIDTQLGLGAEYLKKLEKANVTARGVIDQMAGGYQNIFDPDQIIQSALGIGKAQEASGAPLTLDAAKVELGKLGIPTENIKTDASGTAYLDLGGGNGTQRYLPLTPDLLKSIKEVTVRKEFPGPILDASGMTSPAMAPVPDQAAVDQMVAAFTETSTEGVPRKMDRREHQIPWWKEGVFVDPKTPGATPFPDSVEALITAATSATNAAPWKVAGITVYSPKDLVPGLPMKVRALITMSDGSTQQVEIPYKTVVNPETDLKTTVYNVPGTDMWVDEYETASQLTFSKMGGTISAPTAAVLKALMTQAMANQMVEGQTNVNFQGFGPSGDETSLPQDWNPEGGYTQPDTTGAIEGQTNKDYVGFGSSGDETTLPFEGDMPEVLGEDST